jgi:hypothetical protein
MLTKSFVIAMAADIARSDYAKPTLIRSRSREWLIACRWGPDGEYLSIATAGAMLDARGLTAPDAISPIHSLFDVLVSESETEAASTFLLVRRLPGPIELALSFLPTDTRCYSNVRRSALYAKPAIRTAAVGGIAERSAKTFPTRRHPRRKRWHGTSRQRVATGSASSSPRRCCRKGERCVLPNDRREITNIPGFRSDKRTTYAPYVPLFFAVEHD